MVICGIHRNSLSNIKLNKIDILPMIVTPFDLSNLQEKHVFYLCFSIHNRHAMIPRSWIVIPIVFLGMVSI
jgi:hypothetical protein